MKNFIEPGSVDCIKPVDYSIANRICNKRKKSLTTYNDSFLFYKAIKGHSRLLLFAQSNPSVENINTGIGSTRNLKSTPAVFGGASFNYPVTPEINTNLTAYYYSYQKYYHLANIIFRDGVRGINRFNANLIVNAGVSFEPTKGLYLFCRGKNILNDKSREFFKSDAVPFMLLADINYEFQKVSNNLLPRQQSLCFIFCSSNFRIS